MAPPADAKQVDVQPGQGKAIPKAVMPEGTPEVKSETKTEGALKFPKQIELKPSSSNGLALPPVQIPLSLPDRAMNDISASLKASAGSWDTDEIAMAKALKDFQKQVDTLEQQVLTAVGNDPQRIKEAVERIHQPAGHSLAGMQIEEQKKVLAQLVQSAATAHFEKYYTDKKGFDGGETPEALIRRAAQPQLGGRFSPEAEKRNNFKSNQTFGDEMLDIIREWNPKDAAQAMFESRRLGAEYPLRAQYHIQQAKERGMMAALNEEFVRLPDNGTHTTLPRHLSGMGEHSYLGVVNAAVGEDIGKRAHEFYSRVKNWTDVEGLADFVKQVADVKNGVAQNPERLLAVASAYETYYQHQYDEKLNFRKALQHELGGSPELMKEVDGIIATVQLAAQKKADEQFLAPGVTKGAELVKGAEDRNTQFTNAEKALRAMEAQLLSDDPEFKLKLNQGDKKDPNSIVARFMKLREELPQYAPEVTNEAQKILQANINASKQELDQIKQGIGEVERDKLKSRLDQFVENGEKRAQAEQTYVSQMVTRTTNLEKFIGEVQRSPKPAEGAVSIDVAERQEREKEQQRLAEKEKRGMELGYGSLDYAKRLVERGLEAQEMLKHPEKRKTISPEDANLAHLLRYSKEQIDALVGDLANPKANLVGHLIAGNYVSKDTSWTPTAASTRLLVEIQTLAYYHGEDGVAKEKVFNDSRPANATVVSIDKMLANGNSALKKFKQAEKSQATTLIETELQRTKAQS